MITMPFIRHFEIKLFKSQSSEMSSSGGKAECASLHRCWYELLARLFAQPPQWRT
jgi:hypothetical protein